MRLSRLFFLCLFILSQYSVKAQVYADSQTSGANGLCVGCNVVNPENSVDANTNNYSVLNLTDSVSGAYVYQTFNFFSLGNVDDYVGIVVEDDSLSGLDSTSLSDLELTTFNTGVSNNDTKNSSMFSISLFDGISSKYLIEFQSGAAFDGVEVKLNAGISGTVKNLRIFSAYRNSTPLPIKLINYTATVAASNVDLNWSTATETNNDFFTIEQSTDGINFSIVGTIDGAGNSITLKNYSFTHENPTEGVSYYRLKQTDNDGRSVYFHMLPVVVQKRDVSFTIYPNPLSGGLRHFKLSSQADVEIEIFDELGRSVFFKNINAETGAFIYDIFLEEKLIEGIYFISASSSKTITTQRLVIIN